MKKLLTGLMIAAVTTTTASAALAPKWIESAQVSFQAAPMPSFEEVMAGLTVPKAGSFVQNPMASQLAAQRKDTIAVAASDSAHGYCSESVYSDAIACAQSVLAAILPRLK